MKVDIKFLNPFFTAAFDVITEMADVEVIRGKLSLSNSSETRSLGLSVVIGVVSEKEKINGRVIIDMSKDTAIKFSEKMNFETIGEFNDLVRSSMGEIGNMVSGRAVSSLQNEGFDFNITPPTLFEGDNMIVSDPIKSPTIIVPLSAPFGDIFINLSLATKK